MGHSEDILSFKKGLSEFKKECEEELAYVKKRVAKTAFSVLMDYSPNPENASGHFERVEFDPETGFESFNPGSPFSTGEYIMNHKIGINGYSKDSQYFKTRADKMAAIPMHSFHRMGDYQPALIENPVQRTIEAADEMIARIGPYDKVFIDNKSYHQRDVEFGSWSWIKAKAPPYLTFGMTNHKMDAILNSIVKIFQKKFEKLRKK